MNTPTKEERLVYDFGSSSITSTEVFCVFIREWDAEAERWNVLDSIFKDEESAKRYCEESNKHVYDNDPNDPYYIYEKWSVE